MRPPPSRLLLLLFYFRCGATFMLGPLPGPRKEPETVTVIKTSRCDCFYSHTCFGDTRHARLAEPPAEAAAVVVQCTNPRAHPHAQTHNLAHEAHTHTHLAHKAHTTHTNTFGHSHHLSSFLSLAH